jgi:hypothetical protein
MLNTGCYTLPYILPIRTYARTFYVIAMRFCMPVAGNIVAVAGSPPSASWPGRGDPGLRQAPDISNEIDDGGATFLLAYDILVSSKPTGECYT